MSGRERVNILLVDDEPRNILVLEAMLASLGENLVTATSGQEALWLALGHQHIGFSTVPGTGELLAQLMLGEPSAIDPHPFRPQRFLRA